MGMVTISRQAIINVTVACPNGPSLLMKEVLLTAQAMDLHVEFTVLDDADLPAVPAGATGPAETGARASVPGPGADAEEAPLAVCRVVLDSPSASPALVHGLVDVFVRWGCKTRSIQVEEGGYRTMVFRVACPRRVYLADVHVDLQTICHEHDAEPILRWDDDLAKPKNHSLVVFGLSHVLVPDSIYDVLSRTAGREPPELGPTWTAEATDEKMRLQLAALEGLPAEIVRRAAENLEYTPGARLVMASLKRMGFKTALITGSGVGLIAEQVRQDLGLDYALGPDLEVDPHTARLTGRLGGNTWSDWLSEFHKLDMIRLVADREGIALRDVHIVGDYPMSRTALREFGPRIFFNAVRHKHLVKVLHLIGFSHVDIDSIEQRITSSPKALLNRALGPSEPVPPARPENVALVPEGVAGSEPCKQYVVHVFGKHAYENGQLLRILEPLVKYKDTLQIADVAMSRMHSTTCMAVRLSMQEPTLEPLAPLKDVLFAAKCENYDMTFDDCGASAPEPAEYRANWVITLLHRPAIPPPALAAVLRCLLSIGGGITVKGMRRLSQAEYLDALQIRVGLVSREEGWTEGSLREALLQAAQQFGTDIAVQRDDMDTWGRRIVVFDMDSTLIQGEVIDELAKLAGVEEQVKAITAAAMRGEIDFAQSLRQRCALLKGHNAAELFTQVKQGIRFTPGARVLTQTLKQLGFKMAVISGGFVDVARYVRAELGLDYAFANELATDQDGNFTGETTGPLVTPERKRTLLGMIAEVEGCDVEQVVAVGDGANDIPMLTTSGLGVAFCAKPKVRETVRDFQINHHDLSMVLYLLGLSDVAAAQIRGDERRALPMSRL